MFAIVALVIWLIVPELVDCFKIAASLVPPAVMKFLEFIDRHDLLSDDLIAFLEGMDWKSKISQVLSVLNTGVGSMMAVKLSESLKPII